ncbi:MAG TPA: hypothetical protein VK137_07245, partial [Planctomycetaceae bacterium]|nr:hypothetical protein [Planctomycetaceae bacterium]
MSGFLAGSILISVNLACPLGRTSRFSRDSAEFSVRTGFALSHVADALDSLNMGEQIMIMVKIAVDFCVVLGVLTSAALGEWVFNFIRSR